MPPQVAALCCFLGILGMFYLNRDRTVQTSGALWVPVLWFMIVGSRNVGEWLQSGMRVDAGSAYMEGSPLDRNVLTLLIACGVGVLMCRGQRLNKVLWENWPILLFYTYCGFSIAWSDYPLVGSKRWFRGLGDLVMVLVILTDLNPSGAVKGVLTRVGFILLPLSILLIRYFPELGRAYVPWSGAVIWTGVAGGKNGLGQTCLIYGLAAFWSCVVTLKSRPKNNRRLLAQFAAVVMASYLLWLADSKTSLMCFVMSATLIAAVHTSALARKPFSLAVMVLLLVLGPFSVMFLHVGDGLLESIGRDPTLTGRTDIWELVGKFATNPVLGAGYETFWLGSRLEAIARAHGVFFTQAHNGYIEIYLNLGIVGVALLLLLILVGYSRITAACRRDLNGSSIRLAFFVVALVYNFSEGSFKMMSSVWIAFLLATLSQPLARRSRRLPVKAQEPPIPFLREQTVVR